MRHPIKRSITAALSVLPRVKRHLSHSCLVILTYHRVLPEGHPDLCIMQPGMVVHPDTFRKQLQWLKQSFRIVDLRGWLDENNESSDVACAITFDDGWQDTFEFAYPILQEQQVPATVFLVSDMVDTDKSFWPERLARLIWNKGRTLQDDALQAIHSSLGLQIAPALWTEGPSRESIDAVIDSAKHHPDDLLTEKIASLEQELGVGRHSEPRDILSWGQVSQMIQSGFVTIGSHSRHHIRLANKVPRETLEDEIVNSKALMEKKLGAHVDVFCYPGGVFSSSAEHLVRHHYRAACTTNSGWNSYDADRFRLKRISIHEDVGNDKVSFFAKLSGWL